MARTVDRCQRPLSTITQLTASPKYVRPSFFEGFFSIFDHPFGEDTNL